MTTTNEPNPVRDDGSAEWAYRRCRGLLVRLTPALLHALRTADIPEVQQGRLNDLPGTWWVPPPPQPEPLPPPVVSDPDWPPPPKAAGAKTQGVH